MLRQVVDEAFATQAGEKAIVAARGDNAFERGDFAEAESWWRLLAAPLGVTPVPNLDRVFPDPTGGPVRARAKQLLARLMADAPHWDADLAAFRQAYPEAEGSLAGGRGRYVDLLAEATRKWRETDRTVDPASGFGGDATRGRIERAPADFVEKLGDTCREPAYRFLLEDGNKFVGGRAPGGWRQESEPRSFAFQPLLVDRLALVADASRVTAYDLATGEAKVWYDLENENDGGAKIERKLPAANDLRYTLTRGVDCIYARLGAQKVQLGEGPPPESFLVSLATHPGGGTVAAGRCGPAWGVMRRCSRSAGSRGGLVWIASTRAVNGRAVTAIHCYADNVANTPPFTPPLVWRQDIVSAADSAVGPGRTRHQRLTLAGSDVLYCSHNGVVVALDAVTGMRRWALR